MKFDEIAKIVKGIPYTQKARGKHLYEHILKHSPKQCLELGFAHGVATCYIAAALHEIGSGHHTCVDLPTSAKFEPNVETLLQRAGLESYVTVHREKNCYTWFLQKQIQKNTVDYSCTPVYDLCFIDGPKNWTIDGLAFMLVDKLLCTNGFIIFDDYQWKYSDCSNPTLNGITIREMSEDQIKTPNIELVFQLLVMQHPDYSNFLVDEDWAWAQKVRSHKRTLKLVVSQSLKYKFLKKYRGLRQKLPA